MNPVVVVGLAGIVFGGALGVAGFIVGMRRAELDQPGGVRSPGSAPSDYVKRAPVDGGLRPITELRAACESIDAALYTLGRGEPSCLVEVPVP